VTSHDSTVVSKFFIPFRENLMKLESQYRKIKLVIQWGVVLIDCCSLDRWEVIRLSENPLYDHRCPQDIRKEKETRKIQRGHYIGPASRIGLFHIVFCICTYMNTSVCKLGPDLQKPCTTSLVLPPAATTNDIHDRQDLRLTRYTTDENHGQPSTGSSRSSIRNRTIR
jgi:hypothetical protein